MKKEWFVTPLVLEITVLFICTNINPCFAFDNVKKPAILAYDGKTLYVGGSGPDNYTSIQDAINDAVDGDTVFVYDDSSPYHENIVINISISLIGEDKNTTIIDGAANGNGVNITADNVSVLGFTIQNCSNGPGICLSANNSIITDNIISNNIIGIETYYDPFDPMVIFSYGYNMITNNLIISNEGLGIGLGGVNNTINANIISQTQYGIMLIFAITNNLSNNFILENEFGIFVVGSYNNVIYQNNISKNEKLGVQLFSTSSDMILQNNFVNNGQNAYFSQPIFTMSQIFKNLLGLPIKRSFWGENFWDRPRLMPYVVPGLISLVKGPVMEPPYNFNIFQFDWHPAKKPYDIKG